MVEKTRRRRERSVKRGKGLGSLLIVEKVVKKLLVVVKVAALKFRRL